MLILLALAAVFAYQAYRGGSWLAVTMGATTPSGERSTLGWLAAVLAVVISLVLVVALAPPEDEDEDVPKPRVGRWLLGTFTVAALAVGGVAISISVRSGTEDLQAIPTAAAQPATGSPSSATDSATSERGAADSSTKDGDRAAASGEGGPGDGVAIAGHSSAGTTANTPGAASVTALAALDTLDIKGRAPKTGYDRDRFGSAWADVDRNGCDTRNDILARDLVDEIFKPGTGNCVVLTGKLWGPYTATTIAFQKGLHTSSEVQIDHVVALSDAWQKGAQQLDASTRKRFANDPLNLLAVDGPTNQAKGDGDAATWLPPNTSFRCEYVARQVAVKAEYGLWVTQAEHDAIERVLNTCTDMLLPTGEGAVTAGASGQPLVAAAAEAPAPVVVVEEEHDVTVIAPAPDPVPPPPPAPDPAPPAAPAPDPAPELASDPVPDVYYKNCAAARAAGAAPVYVGEPGYSSKLDRDGDGVGCE